MNVVIWLKYGSEISLSGPMSGVARTSIEIARLLDGQVNVSVYARGRGKDYITPNIPFYGIQCSTELEYIKKTMAILPHSDILHCMEHTYFYLFDEKRGKNLLHLHGDVLPLFWGTIRRRSRGESPYTRSERDFIQERLLNIRRWGGVDSKGIDGIVACSEYISRFYEKKFPGKQPEVIYNPITVNEQKNGGGGDYILFAGALHHTKGIDILIETAKILEEKNIQTPIYVIGSTRLWNFNADEHWKKKFRERRNIVFLGPKDREEVLAYMCEARLGFIPSRTEGLPNVALEFQSCSTPIIASNVGGLPEAVDDGVSGFLVPPDAIQFAEKIIYLLENPALARKMGCAGRRLVEKKFNPEKIRAQYLRLYSHLMKE